MSVELSCYRCGSSLEKLSLPLSRQDLCPECSVYLHACRMCTLYDPLVAKQCREDDAEEVLEKERANFCDWFTPNPSAFDSKLFTAEEQAKSAAAELFGDRDELNAEPDSACSAAEDLFK